MDVMDEKNMEERAEALMQGRLARVWSALLSDEAGRFLLWSILDRCAMFQYPHYGDDRDALMRGRQQLGQQILEEFVFPNGIHIYADMLLEAERRQIEIENAAKADIALDSSADS